jgi:hypothetical protein
LLLLLLLRCTVVVAAMRGGGGAGFSFVRLLLLLLLLLGESATSRHDGGVRDLECMTADTSLWGACGEVLDAAAVSKGCAGPVLSAGERRLTVMLT